MKSLNYSWRRNQSFHKSGKQLRRCWLQNIKTKNKFEKEKRNKSRLRMKRQSLSQRSAAMIKIAFPASTSLKLRHRALNVILSLFSTHEDFKSPSFIKEVLDAKQVIEQNIALGTFSLQMQNGGQFDMKSATSARNSKISMRSVLIKSEKPQNESQVKMLRNHTWSDSISWNIFSDQIIIYFRPTRSILLYWKGWIKRWMAARIYWSEMRS